MFEVYKGGPYSRHGIREHKNIVGAVREMTRGKEGKSCSALNTTVKTLYSEGYGRLLQDFK